MNIPDSRQSGPPRIAGAGIACLDYIVASPSLNWGDTVHVSGFCTQGGGLVATALVACARLGADAILWSLLGDDPMAAAILEELAAERVATEHVVKLPDGASPFSFIHVEEASGERTIFHRPGGNLHWAGQADLSGISSCAALLVDHCYPDLALAAARTAREHGVPVVADLSPGDAERELLQWVDVLIAPRHFARALGCEQDPAPALDAIHACGPAVAVITLGADGWVCSDQHGRSLGTAFPVAVVDTVGAGDVFHGAFAFGLANGWETPRCCEFASAVAAIKCTQSGGRTGIPSLGEAVAFLRGRGALGW